MNEAPSRSRWNLRHAWRSEADLAALALCREQVSDAGIELVDAGLDETPAAAKMHGMEMVDALAADSRLLHDLRGVAAEADWQESLPPVIRRYMVHGERWHGIPMGIHRANAAWVNAGIAAKVGAQVPVDPPALLPWLEQAQRFTSAPLAVGAQPWQVGVLFETVVLGMAGPDAYRRAFEQLQPSAWREPALLEAIDCLMSLRAFVDDNHLEAGWADQLARVRSGEAALLVMGDWVRAAGCDGLLEWAAPGTAEQFVAIVDFFVPLAGSSPAVAERAAEALTEVPFQRRYARRKGCMPAVREAWVDVDLPRAQLLGRESCVLPSFTFDQCCPVAAKQALLEVVADHFVHRRGAAACARALADTTR